MSPIWKNAIILAKDLIFRHYMLVNLLNNTGGILKSNTICTGQEHGVKNKNKQMDKKEILLTS